LPNQYYEDGYGRRREVRDRDRDRDRERDVERAWDLRHAEGGKGARYGDQDGRRYRRDDRYEGRRGQDDRYGGREGRLDDVGKLDGGRLGDATAQNDSGIKFKGRGSMKYREPDRRW